MADKPTYLGLLNAVALAEGRAHAYLTAWADVTPSADVREVLLRVAAREGEHHMSFAKRINELGFQLRDKEDPKFAEQLEIARSGCSDLEKMERLGLNRIDSGGEPDVFDGFFRDHSIDIQTGELLGRYIAEERDTGRLLRHCYELLRGAADAPAGDDRLARLEAKVDAICTAVGELRDVTERAQNGKRKSAVHS